MCGIVGAVGSGSIVATLLNGLARLEYRGYDSAGIATVADRTIHCRRAEGKLQNLNRLVMDDPIEGAIGIAHTRWATHGRPSVCNAHPHISGRVAVVHNGIVENYLTLRQELLSDGYPFHSETDTEVIPVLISRYLDEGLEPFDAIRAAFGRLRGSYAVGALFADDPETIYATRLGSPLAVGIASGMGIVASDAVALGDSVSAATYIEERDVAVITARDVAVYDHAGRRAERVSRPLDSAVRTIGKGAYRHFMAKEIHEQPEAIANTLADLRGQTGALRRSGSEFPLEELPRLAIVACGTSYYAGLVAKYWFETLAALPVDVDLASEFRYRNLLLPPRGAALFISQSGETADTIAALRFARQAAGQYIVSVVNVPESSIARESDLVLRTHCGPEIGVASTKAFTTQLAVLLQLAIHIAQQNGRNRAIADALEQQSRLLPQRVEGVLAMEPQLAAMAQWLAPATNALYLGRGLCYPIALEGALKLKEISYIHAEGYAAGEMKHGPIALLDEQMPVVVLAPCDALFEKTASNLREVRARGAKVLLITDGRGAECMGAEADAVVALPETEPLLTPFVYSVAVQLLAYHAAVLRGTDVDQPRNLAKSVTVE